MASASPIFLTAGHEFQRALSITPCPLFSLAGRVPLSGASPCPVERSWHRATGCRSRFSPPRVPYSPAWYIHTCHRVARVYHPALEGRRSPLSQYCVNSLRSYQVGRPTRLPAVLSTRVKVVARHHERRETEDE